MPRKTLDDFVEWVIFTSMPAWKAPTTSSVWKDIRPRYAGRNREITETAASTQPIGRHRPCRASRPRNSAEMVTVERHHLPRGGPSPFEIRLSKGGNRAGRAFPSVGAGSMTYLDTEVAINFCSRTADSNLHDASRSGSRAPRSALSCPRVAGTTCTRNNGGSSPRHVMTRAR